MRLENEPEAKNERHCILAVTFLSYSAGKEKLLKNFKHGSCTGALWSDLQFGKLILNAVSQIIQVRNN